MDTRRFSHALAATLSPSSELVDNSGAVHQAVSKAERHEASLEAQPRCQKTKLECLFVENTCPTAVVRGSARSFDDVEQRGREVRELAVKCLSFCLVV